MIDAQQTRDSAMRVLKRGVSAAMAAWTTLASACAFLLAGGTAAAERIEPIERVRATAIIADYRKIVAPHGIDFSGSVDIGGIRQWITVRGRDTRNPVLLILHGGPAAPELPTAWIWESPWQDYFTVVQWDQRGGGKTYGLNDRATIGPTISPERLEADAQELITYLRHTYAKQKIFVLGHSWGSLLGMRLAQHRPEWLYAYIGMGQMINGVVEERIGYDTALKAAVADHNATAIAELKAISPYPGRGGALPIAKLDVERKWSVHYGALTWGRSRYDYEENIEKLSPDYSVTDFQNIDRGSALSLPRLWPQMSHIDFTGVTKLDCPVIIMAGRHDTTTASELVARWFDLLHAPSKKLVWFENSAHMIIPEEPGKLLVHLVEDVRPLAVKAGDSAPL